MKKRGVALIAIVFIGFFGIKLSAQNGYFYKMENINANYYITKSREEIQNNNLKLALAYAKKAIQENSWSKVAWDNYNDVVKRVVKAGGINDFSCKIAVPKESPAKPAPTPNNSDDDGSQFEGC